MKTVNNRSRRFTPAFRRRLVAGFTLVELMVVMAVIGIIAAIAAPSFRIAILQGHIQDAKPYMMRIAAAERALFNRTGSYFPAGLADVTNEQSLEDSLGVDLSDAGDFCFMVRRTQANLIQNTATTVDFEIWAVLRDDTYAPAVSNDSVNITTAAAVANNTCVTADDKNEATGWVQANGAASEGRVVVLRYPPPSDGEYTGGGGTFKGIKRPDWVSGITERDAVVD